MRRAALLPVALLSLAAHADPGWKRELLVQGASHEDGDVRWSDGLARGWPYRCLTPAQARVEQVGADELCDSLVVLVRSEAAQPIQCHATLEFGEPDLEGHTRIAIDRIVMPGDEFETARSYGPLARKPLRFASSCRKIDSAPLAPLAAERRCALYVNFTDLPENYYSPGAMRRHEEGEVTLEFTAAGDPLKAQELWVVASSGFGELDNAALTMGGVFSLATNCPGERFRRIIRFRMFDRGYKYGEIPPIMHNPPMRTAKVEILTPPIE